MMHHPEKILAMPTSCTDHSRWNQLHLCVVEVLPLVEFFVEEDIDDKEAVSLLELEPVKKDKDKFKETKSGSKFTLLSL